MHTKPLSHNEVAAGVQGSDLQLDMHDANEPNILEPQHLPNTEALAEGFRGCLQVSHLYFEQFWALSFVAIILDMSVSN